MSKKSYLFSPGVLSQDPDSLQGYYAGFASRAVAIIIDFAIIVLVSTVVVAALALFFNLASVQRFIMWVNSFLPGFDRIFTIYETPEQAISSISG